MYINIGSCVVFSTKGSPGSLYAKTRGTKRIKGFSLYQSGIDICIQRRNPNS
jgi:hypothetical protein